MDCKDYKNKIDDAIDALKQAKDEDKDCTFQVKGKDVRMYAVQGSITAAKAAAQALSFDVGIVEFCLTGLAYGLGIVACEPCGLDNSFALERMSLSGEKLNAWVLKNLVEMIEKKDYVSLQKTGLMEVTTRVVELDN